MRSAFLILFSFISLTALGQKDTLMLHTKAQNNFSHISLVFDISPWETTSYKISVFKRYDDVYMLEIESESNQSSTKTHCTSYSVSKETYDSIITAVNKIKYSDIAYNLDDIGGKDGIGTSIIMGWGQNAITYTIWTPASDTKERKLTDYLNACKLILKAAKFNSAFISQ